MKKTIYSIIALLAFTCCLASCSSDDNGDRAYTHTQTPELEAQGTYVGHFVRLQANSSMAVHEEGEGTLTITATDTAYVAYMRFESAALGISTGTTVNISFFNDGYVFSNNLESNPLGSPISGRISGNSLAETAFQLKIRQGRSTKTYNISFSGRK